MRTVPSLYPPAMLGRRTPSSRVLCAMTGVPSVLLNVVVVVTREGQVGEKAKHVHAWMCGEYGINIMYSCVINDW